MLVLVVASDVARGTPPQPDPGTQPPTEEVKQPQESPKASALKAHYGNEGLEVLSADGNYRLVVALRLQLRASYPFDADPRTPDQFNADGEVDFTIRRARFRMYGHVWRPWVVYRFQYDLRAGFLRDFEMQLRRYRQAGLRAGQYKADYNRERVASSGAQAFTERSIVNREFTVDRQVGLELTGNLMPESHGHSDYYLGVYNGNGRGKSNDDSYPMLLAKWSWHFLGRDPGMSMTDVERHDEPAGTWALGASMNRSPFTRFDTDIGGGQIDGFGPGGDEPGEPGQFQIRQAMTQYAFKHRGFSTQGEFHWKEIEDRLNGTFTELAGAYVQTGYFLNGVWEKVPPQLWLGARAGFVDPDLDISEDVRRELTFGANWFIRGHRNKFTFDASWLTLEVPGEPRLSDYRLRLQWDGTF